MARSPFRLLAVAASCLLVVALCLPSMALAKTRLAFSGGPDGGTFQYFSNAISSRLSKMIPDVEVSNMASAGSVENLRRVNSGDADFGVIYAGDLYLGATGQLTNDPRKYSNVLSMAYLYGAPAHLAVLADSGITQVMDLVGKRVAVGPAGSGAAASAQRYFTALGLWDKMKVEFIGYSEAASSLGDRKIEAMWVFAGYPNSSIIQAAASNSIRLLSLVDAAKVTNFFQNNPYYAEVTIPAGTYTGVDYDVQTVQDSTIWVAGKHVKADIVEKALTEVFSPEGLAYMLSVTKAAAAMSIKDGNYGIVTPLHAGAAKFWQANGLTLTAAQQPL
ncbi:TAXI family TRAP transporter solute-binding subunit [Desulfuromonas thiophila]|uniref:TAXI family TRAP transporter solute-binding subunit n=1 Tax=Desulfuromonas thiophila TaxID=57664 RepID=UPI0024A88E4F|nr:TAXI family TRAP transporter solute-binding subunit [Desulfuromonas thiophila]